MSSSGSPRRPEPGRKRRVVILGAGGREFHNFNVVYRDDPRYHVVAFTAAQIPFIEGRVYPPSLSGPLYPEGIPIVGEGDLAGLLSLGGVDEVVFAYSDVPHEHVMHLASLALASGADFRLLGPGSTELSSGLPVVAVGAVRTGAGKSTITRKVVRLLKEGGRRPVVLRHPMAYGDLERQAVQRFASLADLEGAECTVEEREEYEPHLKAGVVVYSGVDWERILGLAEREGDVLVWDGGNNDLPFLRPDLFLVAVDCLRGGHVSRYHPGEASVRRADVLILTKADLVPEEELARLEAVLRDLNPRAPVLRARLRLQVEPPGELRGKRVVVVEDGPSVTHGELGEGAGARAAREAGAELVDPRPFARGSLAEAYARYPWMGPVLPAMGYSTSQLEEVREAIEGAPADAVVLGTPADLGSLLDLKKPVYRVSYELDEEEPGLSRHLWERLGR